MKHIFIIITILIYTGCGVSQQNIPQNDTNQSVAVTYIDNQSDGFEEDTDEFSSSDDDDIDYLKPYNRGMSYINDKFYTYILNPVATIYDFVMPDVLQEGVSNVFENLRYPIRVTNNILQGKFQNSLEETGRFLINSTIGILGIFDFAKDIYGLKAHNEDFGQTLGYWGVPAGPHIVLPFLGPSNLRDLFGLVTDGYVNPLAYSNYLLPEHERIKYIFNIYQISQTLNHGLLLETSIYALYYINLASLNLGLYESLKKDSLDFYTFSRDFYENKRKQQIKE